jgi:two-component system, cell cycle sensor histidine kinase and response regulator CckA
VAHVLNNRLQIILGFANLIGEDALTRDQRNDLGHIVRAAMDGAEITRQLLQLAGGASCNRELVQLDPVARRIIAELEAAGAGGAEAIRVVIEPAPMVRVDPAHVRYMLMYLLANARRAVQLRGRITIAVGTTVLRHPQLASQGHRMGSGRYGTISVHDTGIGLSPEARSRMFEPFFTTTMIGEGNGLGLPAVQGLLRQNGGYLTFTSDPEHGTTFTLFFPEANTTRAAGAPSSGERVPRESTILIIDADSATRVLTARGLERVGYRVLQAHSIVEALEVIAHLGCPALMVMTEEVERRAIRTLGRLRVQCADVPVLVLATSSASAESATTSLSPLSGTVVRLGGPLSEYLLVSHVQALLREGA